MFANEINKDNGSSYFDSDVARARQVVALNSLCKWKLEKKTLYCSKSLYFWRQFYSPTALITTNFGHHDLQRHSESKGHKIRDQWQDTSKRKFSLKNSGFCQLVVNLLCLIYILRCFHSVCGLRRWARMRKKVNSEIIVTDFVLPGL